eukprot:690953-Pelagomonas_calceolata.AAC.3
MSGVWEGREGCDEQRAQPLPRLMGSRPGCPCIALSLSVAFAMALVRQQRAYLAAEVAQKL